MADSASAITDCNSTTTNSTGATANGSTETLDYNSATSISGIAIIILNIAIDI